MAYADRAGHARTDPQRPRAFAVCDYCGAWYNRDRLIDQYEWHGPALADTGFRACPRCLSKPQEQLRPVLLPPDPVPIMDPRPEYPTVLQNLNGFTQFVGPQGTTIRNPVVAELDPTMPLQSKGMVLASAASGWGTPTPALTDHSGAIALSGVGQLVAVANPARKYLLLFNPAAVLLAVAQNGIPTLGISAANVLSPTQPETGTVMVGTGEGLLQNGLTTPPAAVWLGPVYVLGLVARTPFFVWEG